MSVNLETLIRTLEEAQRALEIKESLQRKIQSLEYKLDEEPRLIKSLEKQLEIIKAENERLRSTFDTLKREKGEWKHRADCLEKYIERKGLSVPSFRVSSNNSSQRIEAEESQNKSVRHVNDEFIDFE